MSDLCKNCTLHGNIKKCQRVACQVHDSWYAQMLLKDQARYHTVRKMAPELLAEISRAAFTEIGDYNVNFDRMIDEIMDNQKKG